MNLAGSLFLITHTGINFLDFPQKFFIFSLFLDDIFASGFPGSLSLRSTVLLVILYDLDVSLDVVDDVETIFRGSHFKSGDLFFDELGQFKDFDVFHFEGFVVSDDGFFPLAHELPLELLIEILNGGGIGVVISGDVAVVLDHFKLIFQFLHIVNQSLILQSELFTFIFLPFQFEDQLLYQL